MSSAPARAVRPSLPWATLLVAALALATHFQPAASGRLCYEHDLVLAGEWWRLWTAHLVHLGGGHLLWNLAVFVPAAAWAERLAPLRARLFLALAPGVIGAALLAFDPALERYAGLSGVAAGALALLAFLKLRDRDSDHWFWRGTLGLLALKIAVETASHQPLLADFGTNDAQPVPLAHLAGIVCAAIASLAPHRAKGKAA